MTSPTGPETDFTYNETASSSSQELLTNINNKVNGTSISSFSYSYDNLGRITNLARQFDNKPAESSFYAYQYDSGSQLVQAVLNSGTSAQTPAVMVQQYAYTYDAVGNRVGASLNVTQVPQAAAIASTANYNNLNQEVKQTPGAQTTFSGTATANASGATMSRVDINGIPALGSDNKTFQAPTVASSDNENVTVVAADNLGNKTTNNFTLKIATSTTTAPTTLTYDLNGNLISSVTGSAMVSYEWDGADQLVAINSNNISVLTIGTGKTAVSTTSIVPVWRTEFTYDGLGCRVRIVEKTAAGAVNSEKRYVWDGMEICEERSASNAETKQYYPQGVIIAGASYYYTRDYLGSIRELVDGSGVVQARYDYDPYGQRSANLIANSTVTSDFGFTGFYYHAPSGLNLAPFRAYSALTGRWLNRDPIQEMGGLNLYGYVANNPVNYVDPLGLWTFEAYGGAIFGGYLSFGYNYGHFSYRAGLGAAAGYSVSFDPKPKQSDLTPGTWEGGLIGKADIGRGPVGAGIEGEVGGTKDPCDKGKKFASAGVSGSALILSGNAGIGEETEPNGANDPDKWHYSAPPPNWQLNIPTDGNVWKGNWLPKERASSGGFVGPFIGHQF